MYTFAYDPWTSTLVGLKSGGTCTDGDYQRLLDSTNELWAQALAVSVATFVLVIDRDQPPPGPRWRQRLAAARPPSKPFRSVIVTSSIVERGVITAIHWLRPPAPGQEIVSLATFEEAITWLEAKGGGGPLPILRTLYEKARAQAQSEAGAARHSSRGLFEE
ncbi:MAG TPA: hypothetical protein VGM06_20650 [Polyangiaceae bacterium]|jgi:hypothetical protein